MHRRWKTYNQMFAAAVIILLASIGVIAAQHLGIALIGRAGISSEAAHLLAYLVCAASIAAIVIAHRRRRRRPH